MSSAADLMPWPLLENLDLSGAVSVIAIRKPISKAYRWCLLGTQSTWKDLVEM